MASPKVNATEAMCSALFRMPFIEFLGEGDVGEDHHHWFHVGKAPRDMRATVIRHEPAEQITLRLEWRGHGPEGPGLMTQDCRIMVENHSDFDLQEPLTKAVLRCLEVYKTLVEPVD